MFVDPAGCDGDPATFEDNDYRLGAGSSAVDRGANAAVPLDLFDEDGDGDVAEQLPFDLGGSPRFVDDPSAPDVGAGTPPLVDAGVWERQLGGRSATPADLDGDGIVGPADLGLLLSAWGPCPCCTADLDHDGAVGASDLGVLLADWS